MEKVEASEKCLLPLENSEKGEEYQYQGRSQMEQEDTAVLSCHSGVSKFTHSSLLWEKAFTCGPGGVHR